MANDKADAQAHTDSVTQQKAQTDAGKAGAAGAKTDEQKAGEQQQPAAGKGSTDAGTQTTDTTTTDQGKAGDETKGAAATSKVPDKYSLAIPDDGKPYVDDDDIAEFSTMARQAGWSNEEAQAAIDEHVLAVQTAAERFLTQTKADPDYGGDKLIETQRLAKVGISLIRPEGHPRRESFLKFLNKVGASNHIEAVSFLADLGRRGAEDSPGQASGTIGSGKRQPEEVLYGGTTAKK